MTGGGRHGEGPGASEGGEGGAWLKSPSEAESCCSDYVCPGEGSHLGKMAASAWFPGSLRFPRRLFKGRAWGSLASVGGMGAREGGWELAGW